MKTSAQKIWLYWWWVRIGLTNGGLGDPFIHTTYSSRLHTASRMQAHHKFFGGKCGRMHKIRVDVEEFK